ncbi:hypothetical protein NON20_10915 [Synechocystis sp. B12]|nr:hypothetical protein NON20_10915 [Synechocystis sp. B12]
MDSLRLDDSAPSSSHLEIGQEIILPVLVHAWMVSDARCLAEVASALAKPLP